jgi:hypothetical protein
MFIIFISNNIANASDPLIIMGDSRAFFLKSPYITNALYSSTSVPVLDTSNPPKAIFNEGRPFWSTIMWRMDPMFLPPFTGIDTFVNTYHNMRINPPLNEPVEPYVAFISLGGNDLYLPIMMNKDDNSNGKHKMPGILDALKKFLNSSLRDKLFGSASDILVSLCFVSCWGHVTSDWAVGNLSFIIPKILNSHNQNKVLLSDIAPVALSYKDKDKKDWNWDVQMNFIAEMMVLIYNAKYSSVLIPSLKKNPSFENRVELLHTHDTYFSRLIFNINCQPIDYIPGDGVHFSPIGNALWGEMIAKKLGALKWLPKNPALCRTPELNPPAVSGPASGSITRVGLCGFYLPPIPYIFSVSDQNNILDVTNAEKMTEGLYKINMDPMVPSCEVKVTAVDTCENERSYLLKYNTVLDAFFYAEPFHWVFVINTTYYTFTPI